MYSGFLEEKKKKSAFNEGLKFSTVVFSLMFFIIGYFDLFCFEIKHFTLQLYDKNQFKFVLIMFINYF